MKRVMITLLLIIGILQAGITFGTGSKVNFGNANVGFYGSLRNKGTITYLSTSRISFLGSSQDTLTNIYTFPNLTINKPVGNLRLNNSTNNFQLTGNITFTQGNLYTGTNTFELGSAATVTGETATKYIVGTVKAPRAVGSGTSAATGNFGGIGYVINNTGSDLGTVTVYRYSGDGSEVVLYGSEGIWRKWTVQTSNPFSGSRSVTSSWLSNEDNGNVLANLKVWKYETAKNRGVEEDIVTDRMLSKKVLAANLKDKAEIRSERETSDDTIVNDTPKTLGWVEVDGATFNYASSPRTATYTISNATTYTINSVSNAFADGAGTAGNPYQVATLAQLNNVRNYPTAHFIQIANIDAAATSGWDAGAGWMPIGSGATKFTGKYNGQGYSVSGLFINRPATDFIGLFGYVQGSEIKNIKLTNVNIAGAQYSGGLIGYNYLGSTLLNSSSQGTVTGTNYVGGLVGWNNSSSIINNCFSKGSVNGTSFVGGLAGLNYTTSEIRNSYSQTNVTRSSGTNTYFAGFTSYNYLSKIINCYSTGSVVYTGYTNPTNRGFVAIIGTGTGYQMSGNFWNTETSGQTTTAGTATGLTKTQMRTMAIFTNAGWDFQSESDNGVEDLWGINAVQNSGYPFLSWEGITHRPSPFAGGIGTVGEPFLVSNLTQLDSVRGFMSNYFYQTADIDASATSGWNAGSGWIPIGTSSVPFTGNYNGQFYKISGITINRGSTNYQGMFGYISASSISNLGLENLSVAGSSYVGGISGLITTGSSITNSYVKGSVTASGNYSGGIAGYVTSSSLIEACYANVSLRAPNYSGGIVGRIGNTSILRNSYVKGTVTRPSGQSGIYLAGVCGYNYATKILKCYSTVQIIYEGTSNPTNRGFTGVVTTGGDYEMADNYWDINTSGQTSTAGIATGKTTAEMKQQGTFVNWDFTTPVWKIHTSINSGYPYLNWEYRIPVEAPTNMALTYNGTTVTITWNAVTGATGYAVYSSSDPYGVFTIDSGTFSGTRWDKTTAETKKFYFVTATNATKVVPSEITINSTDK